MNERIAKFANQSGFDVDATGKFGNYSEIHRLEKFAELIVQECAKVCRDQPNIYAMKVASDICATSIEEHFGVAN